MITEKSNFPICFLAQKTGTYYAYSSDGLGIMISPKEGYIIKTTYQKEFNTKEGFFKHLNELLNQKREGLNLHQEVTQFRFEEVAEKAFLKIFQPHLEDGFCNNMAQVIHAHNFKMGWNLNE